MAGPGVIDQLEIIILMDNNAGPWGTVAESGFSALVRVGYAGGKSKKILFDTGPTGANLIKNAAALDLDLSDLDCIVFSHGHYDHVLGIPAILPLKKKDAFLFCHPAALDKKWLQNDDGKTVILSLHHSISPEELEERIPIKTNPEPVELFPGVFSTGEIPRVNSQEVLSKGLSRIRVDRESGPEVDQIPDDLSLLFRLADGSVVLLTGCCHAGVVNTLHHAHQITGGSKIAGLIGGLHLHDAPASRLNFTVEELRKIDIQEIAACHCTGPRGIHVLKNAFPGRFRDVTVGAQFKYPIP